MLPLCRLTALTLLVKAPIASVPPVRVTVAPLARRLLAPNVKVPALRFTAVAPAVPFKAVEPVTFIVPVPRLPVTVPPLRP